MWHFLFPIPSTTWGLADQFFRGEPVTDQKSGTKRLWCLLGEPGK